MRVVARRAMLLIAMMLCTSPELSAQDKKPPKSRDDEVIRVDTELVEVPVVVTDRGGKPILDLKQSNFTVSEDGKLQQITDFSTSSAPFEVALLLDTSGSTRGELQLIQRAAQSFISSLRPGDRVSIIAYQTDASDGKSSPKSELIADLTSDRAALSSALTRIKTSNGTPYYDSLVQVAEAVFRDSAKPEFRGRRALVALTDGVDSTSATDFAEAQELLAKSGVLCYFININTRDFFEQNLLGDCQVAIRFSAAQIRRYYRKVSNSPKLETTSDFCQLGDFERLAISKKLYEIAGEEMNTLAKVSGGKVFPVGDIGEARVAFKSIADEIGTKYSLGYYSTNDKKDGTFRRIKVEVKGLPTGTQIRAREGYTAPTN
ncbi:MAG TPA: VWA domain-containing protein [Pyrinomonadaceae bacterium]|nr:VWA domain-containing protein [Pyrinomonadaceae bacterium]